MKISVVIPVHNESDGIIDFHQTMLLPVVKDLRQHEIIYVNDGSEDDSLSKLQNLASDSNQVKVINLSRNFGKEAALTAGIHLASGDAIITLDADGQQPPELIPEFINKWQNGAQIVTGIRNQYQKHSLVAKLGSKLFYFMLNLFGVKNVIPNSTDYRLMDKSVQAEFNKLTEHGRITRGLIDWLGFKQEYVHYDYHNRLAGKPSYNFRKLCHLAIDSFISLSAAPITIFGWVGITITIASSILGLFVIIQQWLMGDPLGMKWTGPTCLSIFIAFLVGLLLISQTIASHYNSRIYTEAKGRPLYIIDKKNSKNL
jgi:dolichol-phosphate mannosyltransferase